MSRTLAVFASCWILAVTFSAAAARPAARLWYARPAEKWMGAMVFGGVFDERIQFNEDTLWKGQPHDYVRAGAGDQLAGIRRLLAAGETTNAVALARPGFLSDPVRQKAYQPFGDLRLHFPGSGEVAEYRRDLDLDSALASVSYRLGSVTFRREAFASYPDRALVVRMTADQPGQISFTLTMDSPHTNSRTRVVEAGTLVLTGQVEAGGLEFESRVRVVCEGGTLSANQNTLVVSNATAATLYLVAATSFKNFQDMSARPDRICVDHLASLRKRSFDAVKVAHLTDYQGLFRRVSLDLGSAPGPEVPTDERLSHVRTAGLDTDPGLASLYFQYGRYLLIASSRPGSQPANLQGIWNELLAPPWESKWTLNINFINASTSEASSRNFAKRNSK